MLKTIYILVLLSCSLNIFAQTLDGNAACLLSNKIIIYQWNGDGETSTASLFSVDLQSSKKTLIDKELSHTKVEKLNGNELIYIKENKLIQYNLLSKTRKILHQEQLGNNIIGGVLDIDKHIYYAVILNEKQTEFYLIIVDIESNATKLLYSVKIDLELSEFVEAQLILDKGSVYMFINFSLYEYSISTGKIKKLDSAITSFAIAEEFFYFFKNYKEGKPQLKQFNRSNHKTETINNIDGISIEKHIFECSDYMLSTAIINKIHIPLIIICNKIYKMVKSEFKRTNKIILFKNDNVAIFKSLDSIEKDKLYYILTHKK